MGVEMVQTGCFCEERISSTLTCLPLHVSQASL